MCIVFGHVLCIALRHPPAALRLVAVALCHTVSLVVGHEFVQLCTSAVWGNHGSIQCIRIRRSIAQPPR